MDINKDTVLIKAHYFLFFAGFAPILPYLIVLGVGLGVPIDVMGFVCSLIFLSTVFTIPLLSLIADTFPRIRKSIFIGTLIVSAVTIGSVCFVPRIGNMPIFPESELIYKSEMNEFDNFVIGNHIFGRIMTTEINDSSVSSNIVSDSQIEYNVTRWSDVMLILPMNDTCVLQRGFDCNVSPEAKQSGLVQLKLLLVANSSTNSGLAAYSATSGAHVAVPPPIGPIGVICAVGKWSGECSGDAVWRTQSFWIFFFLLLSGLIAFSAASAFSDAVTLDMIGPSGSYGGQRAWGSLGWGLMGPISGLLVDWWSTNAEVKDYTPAFALVFCVMTLDSFVAGKLKVPKPEVNDQVWGSVWPLVRQPRFFLFLFFSVINGCLDGVVLNFLFVLQEDMAAGTSAMNHIKFIQGMTLFVQSATEVPCMLSSNRILKKIGADRLTTVVFGLYVVRMSLILCVGAYGNVWYTIFIEVFNGPCYGFGFAAIVVYAGQLSPPGTSTTVQGLASISYNCIGYAVNALLSGIIIANIGILRMYLVWVGVALVTCLCHMVYVKWIPPIRDELLNLSRPGVSGSAVGEEEVHLQA